MKKTLLIAAAALAAGVISSQAQVYSQNVVGYVNTASPATSFRFQANQLITGNDVNQTNCNIQAVLGTNGWVSDPNFVNNTAVYVWNLSIHNWDTYYFFTDADAANQFDPTFGNGWYNGSGALANVSLAPGQGYFIKNATGAATTNTLVGSVLQGTNVYTLPQGFTTFSLIQPISTNLSASIVGLTGVSDANFVNNTAYYHYNTSTANWDVYYYFTDADAANQFDPTFGDGWYNGGGQFLANNPADWPKVGEGFFIKQVVASPILYTNKFTVQ